MEDANEIKIFIAYSRLDIEFLNELKTFLSPLIRNKSIATWYDGEIIPGEVWEDKIKQALHTAEIFLLLVSANSLASDYFYDKEVRNALERHQKGESVVVPVILKPCGWKETPLATLQALPQNGKSVTTWGNKDEAYQSIYDGLKDVIKKRQDKKSRNGKEENEVIGKGIKNTNSDNSPVDTTGQFMGYPDGSRPKKPNRLLFTAIGIIIIVAVFIAAKSCYHNIMQDTKVSSDTITNSGTHTPPKSDENAAKINGKIYYNNEPITKYSNAQAVIELMDVTSRNNVTVNTQYNNQTGEFTIGNVPPGKYSPFVLIESGYPFDTESGGDYFSRISGLNDDIVVTSETKEVQANFKVMNVIHLTKPVDNQVQRTSAGDPPETLYKGNYGPSADNFEWDAVPGASYYQVYFLLADRNSNAKVENKSDRTIAPQYSPNLNITSPNNKYMFRVEAYSSANEHIGTFMNYYKNGSGGWFEFTIAPHF